MAGVITLVLAFQQLFENLINAITINYYNCPDCHFDL